MFDITTNGEVACRFASFESASTAEAVVRHLNKVTPGFSRIMKRKAVVSVDWREREKARFASGDYTPVPWASHELFNNTDVYTSAHRARHYYADHFVHISQGQPNKVAYTPDAEYGAADRQIVLSPGKYLKKFYGDLLGGDDIADLCAQFENDTEFTILKSSEDIVEAYIRGPQSCMSKKADSYDSHIHPVSVYGDSDLSLAVLRDSEGDITARALIWEEHKVYGRVYGDEVRLEKHLVYILGYTEGKFEGAKIQYIEDHRGRVVCPYIDWIDTAEKQRWNGKDWLVLGPGGFNVQNTYGFADLGHVCPMCGEHCNEDEGYWLSDIEESVCYDCYRDNAFTCDYCGDSFSDDHYNVTTADGFTVCERCVERGRVHHCDICDEYYFYEDAIAGLTSYGESICESCAKDFVYDEDDGEYITQDEAEERREAKEAGEAEAIEEEVEHA